MFQCFGLEVVVKLVSVINSSLNSSLLKHGRRMAKRDTGK